MADPVTDPAQVTPEAGADPAVPPTGDPAAQPPADPKAGDPPAAPIVPEKYELNLPEGSLLDPSTIEKISAYAKEKGLSNEAAQEVLNRENAIVTAYHEAQNQQVTEIRNAWVKEAESDKEIGGDKFKENLELAKRVVNRFGSEAFKAALNETGFGNHPEVIRTFARIGLLMADDKLITGGSNSDTPRDMAHTFYPDMK